MKCYYNITTGHNYSVFIFICVINIGNVYIILKHYEVSAEELYTFKVIQKTKVVYLEIHTRTSR
jgi:hypothetical protein